MAARSTMRFLLKHAAIVAAITLIAPAGNRAAAEEPIEIFDAHLHYNWEPKPFYQLDEVLALFKKHRVTGILATSRPNTGTHVLMDAKAQGLQVVPFIRTLSRPRRHRDLVNDPVLSIFSLTVGGQARKSDATDFPLRFGLAPGMMIGQAKGPQSCKCTTRWVLLATSSQQGRTARPHGIS
jgi:hypothetical protein